MLVKIQILISFGILFLLYFGFQIGGLNTRYLATALLMVSFLFPSCLRQRRFVFNKKFTRVFKLLLVYNIITILITILHGCNDFMMFAGTFRLVVFWLDCMLLYLIIPKRFRYRTTLLLIGAFLVQSLIIFAAFFSPSFLSIIRQFQYEELMEIADRYLNYGRFRGLALSGDQFHGLTAAFGLISIYVMHQYTQSKKLIWITLVSLKLC